MADAVKNVLFLCTGNSCRSIIAEALLNHLGQGRFRAFSAGSHPAGTVNPKTLQALGRRDIPAPGARSKSWDEFAAPKAPKMDFIITVCNNAAGEACPVWPGRPAAGHWGVADPGGLEGNPGETAAFDDTVRTLEARIAAFLDLPLDQLSGAELKRHLNEIGKLTAE
ncbi:MAG: arsenate reductase ArsC [Rhodospirillales bacterium]|nr:arsenate reductase ArsC [Rhodospirillales bacterium]